MAVPQTGTANERIGQQAVDLTEARRQRDDLLAALRDVTNHFSNSVAATPAGSHGRRVINSALATIEKAEKG